VAFICLVPAIYNEFTIADSEVKNSGAAKTKDKKLTKGTGRGRRP
jgi:hypothetical protein